MSYTLQEFFTVMEDPNYRLFGAQKCHECGEVLNDCIRDEWHKLGGDFVCEDCYFKAFGKEIEEHPICMPRAHHG